MAFTSLLQQSVERCPSADLAAARDLLPLSPPTRSIRGILYKMYRASAEVAALQGVIAQLKAKSDGEVAAAERGWKGIGVSESAWYDCWNAIADGDLDGLEKAKQSEHPFCVMGLYACSIAAENGHLKVLQFLRNNGCPWDESACCAGAEKGHLEVVKWLHDNGCPCEEKTFRRAAIHRHLDVLQWMRANGCPWIDLVCLDAAENGQVKVLEWLRNNGCPWDKIICLMAANKRDDVEMKVWIRSH